LRSRDAVHRGASVHASHWVAADMTVKATIREAELRRLAKVAKAEGVCIRVMVGGIEIEIRDEGNPIVDAKREMVF
jgi:hypothetical protein